MTQFRIIANTRLEKILINSISLLSFCWLVIFSIGITSANQAINSTSDDLTRQEIPIQLRAQSTFQNFPSAAIFSDSRYATLRLENFGTQNTNGTWSGPDFIVAQSGGTGLFYLQPGGNIYSAGQFNVQSGIIREDLQIEGNILIPSGRAVLGSLNVSGEIDVSDNAVPWDAVSKNNSSANDLSDITFTTPASGEALFWDSTNNHWSNQTPFNATGQREISDYVIYLDGDNCLAFNGSSGSVTISNTNHATCIQAAIDSAGTGGVLSFRAGDYRIDTQLEPQTSQTWWMNKDAVFSPTGDNRIINLENLDYFSLHGTLMIRDDSGNSSSAEAMRIEDVAYSYLERVVVINYYRGISITGTGGGTHENTFSDFYLQVRDRGLSLETSCHDNHFMHVWIKGPSPTEFATGPGLYIATGGTQGGNVFNMIEILDMNQGMDLPGAFEAWFGNVLIDNPYAEGIVIGGSVERLFFDTIWTASGGDGVIIRGDTSSYADKIQIGKLYSWLNNNYGIRIDGYVENLNIGMITVQRNARGLVISGVNNRDITIGSITSFENTQIGVDGSGVTRNVYINNAMISDGVLGLDYFTEINGTRPGTGQFESRGIAKILNGQSTVTVVHGLEGTPTNIALSPYDSEVSDAYISARNSTSFTITVGGNVSANREIGWTARSGRQLDSEILSNSSFEEGTSTPTNWNASVAGTQWPSDVFRSGYRSLRLIVSSDTADWRSDAFEIDSNGTYRLRGFVRGTGSAQTYITIRWFSDSGGSSFISEENISLNNTYTDWTEVRSDITAPATAQSADILFRVAASSTADIYGDEFSLRKVM